MTAWYKVLVDGKSCHGGSLAWSLPKDGKPGEWHEVAGDIRTCSRGLHLTSDPAKWFDQPTCKVYLAEGDEPASTDGDKVAFRRARLIRELTADDLVAVCIFVDRNGQVPAGKSGIAYGKSQVTARGNSTVTALENSTVTAWGNSTVTAWGTAIVSKPHVDCNCCKSAATVTLTGSAVLVDQTGDAPKVTTAAGELIVASAAKVKAKAEKKPAKRARKASK